MIHTRLETGNTIGVTTSPENLYVVLQLTNTTDATQVRVHMTSTEVDALINALQTFKQQILPKTNE